MLVAKGSLVKSWDGTVYKVLGIKWDYKLSCPTVVIQMNISRILNGGYEPAEYMVPFKDFFNGKVIKDGKSLFRYTKVSNV